MTGASVQPTRRWNPWGDAKGCLLWFGILGGVALVVLALLGSQMKQEQNSLDESRPRAADELIGTLLKISGRVALDEGSDFVVLVERSTRDCVQDDGRLGTLIELQAQVPLDEVGEPGAGLDRVEEYWRGSDPPVGVEGVARGEQLTGSAAGFDISANPSGGLLLLQGLSPCTSTTAPTTDPTTSDASGSTSTTAP